MSEPPAYQTKNHLPISCQTSPNVYDEPYQAVPEKQHCSVAGNDQISTTLQTCSNVYEEPHETIQQSRPPPVHAFLPILAKDATPLTCPYCRQQMLVVLFHSILPQIMPALDKSGSQTPTAPVLTPCQPSPSVYYVSYSTMEQPGSSTFPGPPPIQFATITFGRDAVSAVCPHCNQPIVTRISPRPGALAYILFFVMFIFGCWLCCFIPFCIEGCQDIEHRCPNCDKVLGIYKRT